MKAVRDALGPDVDIAADAHAALSNPFEAVELADALAPYRPLFLEEPLRPENRDALASVKRKTHVPIATGEMLYSKWEFRELLDREAADIVQPDICIAGGITELKKIAALAETFCVPLAPHNPMGPVATAANVHLSAAIANFFILEYLPDDTADRRDIVDEPVPFRDGWLDIPDKPGLGIEIKRRTSGSHEGRMVAPVQVSSRRDAVVHIKKPRETIHQRTFMRSYRRMGLKSTTPAAVSFQEQHFPGFHPPLFLRRQKYGPLETRRPPSSEPSQYIPLRPPFSLPDTSVRTF